MGDCIDDDVSPPIRVMIVGDSMTQGREGDFTWRYRLWQWMTAEGVNFQFVGPYKGTKTPEVSRPTHPPASDTEPTLDSNVPVDLGGYAAGVRFDSCHFSVWGLQATQCNELVQDQVERFRPDYMLVMLGFNDMGWGVADAKGTIVAMEQLINRTRAANPTAKLAIADVPQRTPMEGTEKLAPMVDRYNQLLRTSARNWGTQQSPIELVEIRDNYDCSHGSYDGLHPNALGEFQIARAFSRSLVRGYSIGTHELSIPLKIPERPTPVPANIVAEAVAYGVAVTWDAVYGALGYDVRSREGTGSLWIESRTESNRCDSTCTQEGLEYHYQVRTYNGDSLVSAWSKVVSAMSRQSRVLDSGTLAQDKMQNG
ncbi:fibronectin type III domain-containing protein [Colletotrichum graminicola]|uniref:Fibronectin type III domain-containing protein n=1 Tax=Colletotrichum graminicola (strain M1.001 / M2 / FGSC 10212) TaxID=645133 RepID=E3Q4J0_COLGM|nr:fibronectin type III domain-containing protein [Colletotrichum graminicola M1.001]EFQ26005.1 fibronectin type III domain-containing protein [Colletotrichum graminicola M1.001]WDK23131.1 fibronectin type III domain-containing protein [Colletotrichum graminicola]